MPRGNGGVIGPANIPTTSVAKGVWSLMEQQLAQRQGIWPAGPVPIVPDPYFDYTTLLLPGNGTNGAQNNTFLDGSTNNFTITRNGNTTQGTFSPFSQTGWALLNTTNPSQGISSSTSSDFSFSTGDWSVECWIYRTGNGGNPTFLESFIDMRDADVTNNGISIGTRSDGTIYAYDSGLTTASGVFTSNSWNHIVYSRQSSAIRIFVNGVLRAYSSSYTSNYTNINCRIGTNLVSGYGFIGYISNVRIIKGSVPTSYQTSATSLGTSVFTPSTSPLTTTSAGATASAVSLLTCQSNRFVDNSTANPKTITTINAPSVVAFSPFNPTASWSAATYGGSGYFDGSGDYLTTPSSTSFAFGGNWTIEFWFYPLSQPSSGGLIAFSDNKDNIDYTLSSNSFLYYNGSTATTFTGVSVTVAAWNHIAVVNASGTVRGYVNGSQSTNSGSGVTTSSARSFNILANVVGSAITGGYVSGLRVVNGTAVYTGAFTPPTAPISTSGSASASAYPSTTNVNTSFASSDTKLLLNCTNAGIYDATSKNDLETVGNAQISTTQSKWGGSSIYLDGTGDYLDLSPSGFSSFGTGNFTVEFWMRTAGSSFNIINPATATGTGYWALLVNTGSGGFRWNDAYNVTNLWTQTATSVLDNNWHHIAVVRNGTGSGNVNIYFDGVAQGTAKTDSTNYNGASTAWRIGSGNVGDFNGYIQDLRITPGIARYTANFTAPTAAFPTL